MSGSCNGSDNEMHRQVEWLTAADVSILEFMHSARDTRGNPAILRPATISDNVGHARKYVGERCRHLVDHGLAEQVDRGKYRLSSKGEKLMTGDIRPEDLDENRT